MKTAGTLLLTGLLLLAFSGAALYAQAPSLTPAKGFRPSKEAMKEDIESYEGTIEKVDVPGAHLTVKRTDGQTGVIPLLGSTTIGSHGSRARVEDLAPGRKVHVDDVKLNGRSIRIRIDILD